MNEWLYILLGFLGGIVFTSLVIVSVIKRLFTAIVEREKRDE